MKLVIDSNIIFSSFIKDRDTRKLILNPILELITPDFSLDEIKKYEELICSKGNISPAEFQLLIFLLFEKITIIPHEEYEPKIKEAETLIEDINDVPFLALTLATRNEGIWSNDAEFKKQKMVRVWSTRELLNYYELL